LDRDRSVDQPRRDVMVAALMRDQAEMVEADEVSGQLARISA